MRVMISKLNLKAVAILVGVAFCLGTARVTNMATNGAFCLVDGFSVFGKP